MESFRGIRILCVFCLILALISISAIAQEVNKQEVMANVVSDTVKGSMETLERSCIAAKSIMLFSGYSSRDARQMSDLIKK